MPPLEPALLLEHADFVRALARSLIRDPGGAADVEQETWLRALQHGPRDRRSVRGWLATIVTNVVRNRARETTRRARREAAVARPDRAAPSSLAAEQSDTLRSVVSAVVELDEPYRSTVLALYFQALSPREIAEREQISEATVRSRHRRALEQLREKLDARHGARETWCASLAGLAGLETASTSGAGVAALGWAIAAGVLVVGGAWWWSNSRGEAPASIAMASTTVEEVAAPPSQPALAQEPAPSSTLDTSRTPSPAAEVVLRGRVQRIDGGSTNPASGVDVRVVLASGGGFSRQKIAETTAVSDDDGRFETRFPDPGARPISFYTQVAATETHRAATIDAPLENETQKDADIEVQLAPHGDLDVLVERQNGSPFAGALVRLTQRRGEDAREQVTDESGLTRFANVTGAGQIEVRSVGWIAVASDVARPVKLGGWEPMRVVLAPEGAMRVRVEDARGAPLAEAEVVVERAPWERESDRPSSGARPPDLSAKRAECDSNGEAHFASVWSGCDLRVSVAHGRQRFVATQRAVDGLLLQGGSDGASIRVAPGQETEVRARWSGDATLELAMKRADGQPLEKVHVEVFDLGRALGDSNRAVARLEFTEPREVETRSLAALEFVGPLAFVAVEELVGKSEKPVLQTLGYAGDGGAVTQDLSGRIARAVVELPRGDARSEPVRVELTLEPTYAISGRLLDPDGAPAKHHNGSMGGHRIWVVERGGSRASTWLDDLSSMSIDYRGENEFEIGGLPEGRYDVLVSTEIDRFYTFSSSVQRFEDIAAGSHGLELRLNDERTVRVKLKCDADPELVRGMIVLTGALTPIDATKLPQQHAPHRQTVRGLSPWPEGAPIDFAGIGGGRDALGQWAFGCDPVDGVGEFEAPALAPGWYVFGVHPSGRDRDPYAPIATELAWYDGGEYEIEFELTRVCDVTGVVLRDPDRPLAIELVDANGRRAPHLVQGFSGRMEPRAHVPTSGRMLLREVPLGVYRLRVGSPSQLERGEFAREIELVVEPGMASFEIDGR